MLAATLGPMMLGFVAGLCTWTLLEWVIHNVLGHWPRGKTTISREHIKHHADINYFSPLPLKLRGAVPVLLLAFGVAWLVAGTWAAAGFSAAIALGWTVYEGLHKAIHVRGPKTRYGRWAAKNHLYHHFMQPHRNHGVTSPIWDYVFRTHDKVDKVRVREKDLPDVPWLAEAMADPERAASFLQDYELKPRAHAGQR